MKDSVWDFFDKIESIDCLFKRILHFFMEQTDPFPEKDWKFDRFFYQGQIRSMAICKKKVIFGNTEIVCGYYCRKDRPSDAKHLCTFNRITNYFNDTYRTTPLELAFFNMIVRSNMSFSAAVSNQMFYFIQYLIRVGQNSVLDKIQHNPNITVPSPLNIFPQISRQTLSRNFQRAADSIRHTILQMFKKFRYVCLAIDAGKINGNPILDVTIVNSFCSAKPLLYRAFKNFNGTSDQYIANIKSVIQDLDLLSISVTSIVGDNLPAQKNAFDSNSPISMQRQNPKTIFSQQFWFSCICHTISLALDDAYESVDFLNELNTSTMLITKILRSKPMVSVLGIVCPSFCETRWSNEYDIYTWILKNHAKIEETFLNPPEIIFPYLQKIPDFPKFFYCYIPRYIKILTPISDLITYLEGDHTPACFTYPSVVECKKRLAEIIEQNDDENLSKAASYIYEQINARLNSHYSFLKLKVLYYLTPEGREDARKTVYSDLIESPDSNHDAINNVHIINDTREEIEKLIMKFDPTDLKYSRMAAVFNNIDPQADDPNYESEDESYELIDFPINLEDDYDGSIDQTCIYFKCITDIAENYYRSQTDNEDEIKAYGNRIGDSFVSWIIDPLPERELESMYSRNPYQYWTTAKQYENLTEFSEFVLRLLPTVASEATVERKLWKQRVITPSDRYSMSEETQLNRITIADYSNAT